MDERISPPVVLLCWFYYNMLLAYLPTKVFAAKTLCAPQARPRCFIFSAQRPRKNKKSLLPCCHGKRDLLFKVLLTKQ